MKILLLLLLRPLQASLKSHAKEALSQAHGFCIKVLTAKLIWNALTAQLLSKALTANSSSCSSSSKVLSSSVQILSTCASRLVPKDNRHLYCLRSLC